MSRVTIKNIVPGAKLDPADVLDTNDSWKNQDNTINDDNLREEALDRRMFTARTITPSNGLYSYSSVDDSNGKDIKVLLDKNYSDTWLVPTDSGGTIAMVGPIDFTGADNHMLLIRSSYVIDKAPLDASAVRPYDRVMVKSRLVYDIKSSAPAVADFVTALPGTYRETQWSFAGHAGSEAENKSNLKDSRAGSSTYSVSAGNGDFVTHEIFRNYMTFGMCHQKWNVSQSHYYQGDNATASNKLYVALQFNMGGGTENATAPNAQISHIYLMCTLFGR